MLEAVNFKTTLKKAQHWLAKQLAHFRRGYPMGWQLHLTTTQLQPLQQNPQ